MIGNGGGRPMDYATMPPLVVDRLQKPRSVFAAGHRLRMNVVPMFVTTFLPWGVFIFCCGLSSFWVAYVHPVLVACLLCLIFVLWLATVALAVWARRSAPDPTWFTYLAVTFGIAAIAGTILGRDNFSSFSKQYFTIRDLQVVNGIDASLTPGHNVMDAGIIQFHPGNRFDDLRTWHFKHKTVYCVAPIITNGTVPLGGSYDFWAVGKDCCSETASDFRCGAWGSVAAKSGIRVVNDGDTAMYRLAVQQAMSLYDLDATHPIFLSWSENPLLEVSSWNQRVFKNYLMQVIIALIWSVFFMSMATCKFAWLGRGSSAYEGSYAMNGAVAEPGVRSFAP